MKASLSVTKRSVSGAVLLAVGLGLLILAGLVIAPSSVRASGTAPGTEDSVQLSNAAMAARWLAMGNYYAAQEAAIIERSNAAMVARWQALGNYYAARGATSVKQSDAVIAARLRENGKAYAALQEARR